MEDAAAGVLNGLMISLLGGVLPAALAWQVVSHLWRGDLDLRPLLSDAWPFLGGVFLSLLVLRTGVRLLHENTTSLLRRRAARSDA